MSEIRFSVIIPHKNIPSLLSRCLDSIPEREDIQVVIVDDNSDISIVDFSSFPGMNRKNTTILYTKNGKGAGYARNCALQEVQGVWTIFIDADDFFSSGFWTICDEYYNSDFDIVFFNSKSVFSDSLEPANNRVEVISQYQEERDDNLLRYKNHVVWARMTKTKLIFINNILFEEVPAANDVYFAGECGYYANKIYFDERISVYCTLRSGSITTRKPLSNLLSYVRVTQNYNRFLHSKNIPIKYWENSFGPILRLCGSNFRIFVKYFIAYFLYTHPLRVVIDLKESFGRFVSRLFNKNSDKEMRELYTKNEE